jgi:hypothetical protein
LELEDEDDSVHSSTIRHDNKEKQTHRQFPHRFIDIIAVTNQAVIETWRGDLYLNFMSIL